METGNVIVTKILVPEKEYIILLRSSFQKIVPTKNLEPSVDYTISYDNRPECYQHSVYIDFNHIVDRAFDIFDKRSEISESDISAILYQYVGYYVSLDHLLFNELLSLIRMKQTWKYLLNNQPKFDELYNNYTALHKSCTNMVNELVNEFNDTIGLIKNFSLLSIVSIICTVFVASYVVAIIPAFIAVLSLVAFVLSKPLQCIMIYRHERFFIENIMLRIDTELGKLKWVKNDDIMLRTSYIKYIELSAQLSHLEDYTTVLSTI